MQSEGSIGFFIVGKVSEVGEGVDWVGLGDRVCAVVREDQSDVNIGFVSVSAVDVISLPEGIEDEQALVSVIPGIAARLVCFYALKVRKKDSLVVIASRKKHIEALFTVDLAIAMGMNVLLVNSDGDIPWFSEFRRRSHRIFDSRKSSVSEIIHQQLEGIGADSIVDFREEFDVNILLSLAMQGTLVTSCPRFCMTEEMSHQMFQRGSSVHFLNVQALISAPYKRSKFCYIIQDVFQWILSNPLEIPIKRFSFSEHATALKFKQCNPTQSVVLTP